MNAESLEELIKTPFRVKTHPESLDSIEYPVSGRIFVVDDSSLITRTLDKKEPLENNTTISIINYIATSYTARMNYVTEQTIIDYNSSIHLQKLVEKSIENKSFEVFMQPIYDIKSKKFTGAEALLRLRDEQGNYVPPLSFIPDAEQNGDIIKISDIMLEKTCEFINETKLFEKGIETVNVNLSMIQCMQEGIIEHIISILDENNIDPQKIRLEITESVAATNEQHFARVLDEMNAYGIEYALDDYGTGYSNTSKMLSYDFSEIKFDKSVIDGAIVNNKQPALLKHLIALSKEMNMITLAEGIETRETADILISLGCDMIQGFYYAHPMPKEEFSSFLDEKN